VGRVADKKAYILANLHALFAMVNAALSFHSEFFVNYFFTHIVYMSSFPRSQSPDTRPAGRIKKNVFLVDCVFNNILCRC